MVRAPGRGRRAPAAPAREDRSPGCPLSQPLPGTRSSEPSSGEEMQLPLPRPNPALRIPSPGAPRQGSELAVLSHRTANSITRAAVCQSRSADAGSPPGDPQDGWSSPAPRAGTEQQSCCPARHSLRRCSTCSFKQINKADHREVILKMTRSFFFFLKKVSTSLKRFLFQRFCPFLCVLAKKLHSPIFLKK